MMGYQEIQKCKQDEQMEKKIERNLIAREYKVILDLL
jgi:hypothetical protein